MSRYYSEHFGCFGARTAQLSDLNKTANNSSRSTSPALMTNAQWVRIAIRAAYKIIDGWFIALCWPKFSPCSVQG